MGLQLIGKFESYKSVAQRKAQKAGVNKMTVPHSTDKDERLFINIGSPSTASIGGKKHQLLIVENNADYTWSIF